jgi:release factor glutamine methyltransferase
MNLKQALQSAIQQLGQAQVGSPRINAETLLMFVLGRDRAYLYAHGERVLSAEEILRYQQLTAERARGVPAQYITGHQEFWGMDLLVSPAVLIPRPETEHVVETVLELSQGRAGNIRIVDVGTGSGCIALALAKELPQAEIHATEISATALEVARANAARHQLAERVHFHQTDLLNDVAGLQFDFVVSNPPYVGESEKDTVEAQVRKFEPQIAVFAGETGMEVFAKLIPQALKVLSPGGWLVMELAFSSYDRVRQLLLNWSDLRFSNDLQGIPRVVAARKG